MSVSHAVGPLDQYRKQSSFNWNKLRTFMDDIKTYNLKVKVWNVIESDPLFHHPAQSPSSEEQRRLTAKRIRCLWTKNFISLNDFLCGVKVNAVATALGQYDVSLALVYPREYAAFLRVINAFGTQRHKVFLQDCLNNKISGCVAAEEICGSFRTTATFDNATQEFELQTPDFEAAKCWKPMLGATGTHAVVYAKLITGDGVDRGVHILIVPVRNPVTLVPCPGVIIGDMGETAGQNGADSGFLMFNKCRVPRENLLDGLADVTPSGTYIRRTKVITFDDVQQRLTIYSLVASASLSAALLAKCVTIAIRYSAVRKQFGPTTVRELPVIEYQLQQWRLFPYIAASYAFKIFADFLGQTLDRQHAKDIGAVVEMQQLASVGKYVITTVTCDGSQECREACGGHGYLKVAGIGDIRNDNDGEHVSSGLSNAALLQCSSWLLELWSKQQNLGSTVFNLTLGSVKFLSEHSDILKERFTAKAVSDAINPEVLLSAYQWLVCWLLQLTEGRLKKHGYQLSNCEVFNAAPLARAYIEHYILQKFVEHAKSAQDHSVKNILLKLSSLYGVWCLEKHLPFLYQGGYMNGRESGQVLQEGLLQLCASLKAEAVSLVDVLAPPDKVLSSVLGHSDGNVYRNIQDSFFSSTQTFERPEWWKEVTFWQQSKL